MTNGAAVAIAIVSAVAAQPAAIDLVVVIDSDSPVENRATGDRLRDAALDGFDTRGGVAAFELTERGTSEIPSLNRDAIRDLHFTGAPRIYSGISLSVNEASEILRKNEPVREEVIRRSCPQQSVRDCGGAVHAAAMALVQDIDAAAARKGRALAGVVRSTRAKTLAGELAEHGN